MGKKRGKKKQNPAVAPETTITKQNKGKKEDGNGKKQKVVTSQTEAKQAINDLFNQHKTKKKEQPVPKSDPKPSEKPEKADKLPKDDPEGDDFFDSRGKKSRRKVIDGVKVYSLAELGVGKGGDTDLCPFDCECCF